MQRWQGWSGAMTQIRYRLHFSLLIAATFIFWLLKDLHFPYWVVDFDFLPYMFMGLLYATATIVSLRRLEGIRPVFTVAFIVLAVAWSAATPILALWTEILWYPLINFLPVGEPSVAVLFIQGSIVGSLGYWLLVRWICLKSLRRADWLKTLLLCSSATLISIVVSDRLKRGVPFDLLLTTSWWFAFSASLYWSEMSRQQAIPKRLCEEKSDARRDM